MGLEDHVLEVRELSTKEVRELRKLATVSTELPADYTSKHYGICFQSSFHDVSTCAVIGWITLEIPSDEDADMDAAHTSARETEMGSQIREGASVEYEGSLSTRSQSVQDDTVPDDIECASQMGTGEGRSMAAKILHSDSSEASEDHLRPKQPGIWRLRKFGVREQWRGQGIGSKLLSHVLEDTKQMGAKGLWLTGRMSAMTLYDRFGFQKYGPAFYYQGYNCQATQLIF